jgi:pteridine reductase
MDPRGKSALVTGGAHRVGGVLSRALARAGAQVVVNYRSSAAAAQRTVDEIREAGGHAVAVQADVSNGEQVRRLVAEARAHFGRLDIVVNSASLFEACPFEEISEQAWDRVLAVNLKGPFLLAQAAAPQLRAHGEGLIVNILDLSAFQAWPSYLHHGVSKAGLHNLTRTLARLLAPAVRVNAIAPGTVLPPPGTSPEEIERDRQRIPLARIGSPEDVARALLFLVQSDFITGETIVVDGGRMLR